MGSIPSGCRLCEREAVLLPFRGAAVPRPGPATLLPLRPEPRRVKWKGGDGTHFSSLNKEANCPYPLPRRARPSPLLLLQLGYNLVYRQSIDLRFQLGRDERVPHDRRS